MRSATRDTFHCLVKFTLLRGEALTGFHFRPEVSLQTPAVLTPAHRGYEFMVGCISVLIASYFHPSSVQISIPDVSKCIHQQYVCGTDLCFGNDFKCCNWLREFGH
jgi:hypothetical protein